MKLIAATFRFIFLSFEFLICVAGVGITVFAPDQLTWLTNKIGEQTELLKYFGFLPAGLVYYDSTLLKSILMPDADKQNTFQKFEYFGDFQIGCWVGLIYGVLFAIGGITCFLFDWKTPNPYPAAFLFTSILGALTVTASLFFAHIKIEVLFRQHTPPLP